MLTPGPKTQNTKITFDARIAFRNKGDEPNEWKYLASSLEHRNLECQYVDDIEDEEQLSSGQKNTFQQHQHCQPIFLFELGSLHHDYYLVNVRLPIDTEKNFNLNLLSLNEVSFLLIHYTIYSMIYAIIIMSILLSRWDVLAKCILQRFIKMGVSQGSGSY